MMQKLVECVCKADVEVENLPGTLVTIFYEFTSRERRHDDGLPFCTDVVSPVGCTQTALFVCTCCKSRSCQVYE